jgi:hypothetical protein
MRLLTFWTVPHAAHSAPILFAKSRSHPVAVPDPRAGGDFLLQVGWNGNEPEAPRAAQLFLEQSAEHSQTVFSTGLVGSSDVLIRAKPKNATRTRPNCRERPTGFAGWLAVCTGPAASVHAPQWLFAVQSSGAGRSLSAAEGPYVRTWHLLISGCGIADVDEPLAYGAAPSPTTENGPQ